MRTTATITGLLALASSVFATTDVSNEIASFKCPKDMSYSPWTRACACAPGKNWDIASKSCVGKEIVGCWPEPDVSIYANVDIEIGTFCAISPYKIVKYDPHHKYCQASINSIAFCATVDIEVEVNALGLDVEIDVEADISADLRNVCGGLAGLYLESVIDAVVLFNTDKYGLAALHADIFAHIGLGGLTKTLKSLTCFLGLGHCNYDCVSYCTKGCKNYIDIDVVGKIGGGITGLVGLCILPNIILVVNHVGIIVTIAIDHLLCLVGNILKVVLGAFDCHCGA